MAINREISQFSNFVSVDDTTRQVSISTSLDVGGNVNISGVCTATTFYGDFQGSGSGITGITATYAATAGVSTVSQGLTGTPDISIDDLYVSGVSTFRDRVRINRSTTNEGLTFEFSGGYRGGLTAASNEFRVTSNGTKDLLLGSNNAGGTSGDVVIASVGAGNSYSTGWGRMAVFGGTGTAELYYQDVKKFEVTGVGATVFGTLQSQQLNISGVSTFIDGGNGEIKVYEDSGDPIIEKTGGGSLHFKTNNGFDIENGTDYLARYGSGGGGVGDGVSLFHNGLERIATTNAGAVVTGILTANSFRGDGSQLTGVLAASEAGISVQDDQSSVGVSTTIDFGSGLSVSPVSAGVVTVTSGASAGISPVIAGMIF